MRTSTSILCSLDDIDAAQWNALRGAEHPFLRHEFLAAFEHSGCVGADSGWEPCHLILRDVQGSLVAAMPLYRKLHSWGEFVFDFAWAQAYTQAGLPYYPKLVCAIPFTPAGGPRWLTATAQWEQPLLQAAMEYARTQGLSSFHVLFPQQTQTLALQARGMLLRRDCQFHWHNRDYADFEHFLAGFTAEKRKKVRRERRRVTEAGVSFRTLTGTQIDAALWQHIYAFHAATFLAHGHMPYLSLKFFEEIAVRLPDNLVVFLAEHDAQPVAAAICFRGPDTLYGRYWGAGEHFHSLHFETCYYQGIDYCIRNGLQRFEPGTQGEHKVARGFVPTDTWSAHWIADARFREAIGSYLVRETEAVGLYAADVQAHAPYRRGEP